MFFYIFIFYVVYNKVKTKKFQLYFTGTCYQSFKGDIAIDDIKIEKCQTITGTVKPTVSGMFEFYYVEDKKI